MNLPILSSLLCALLITANFMAVKTVDVFCFTLPAAVLCYPFSYVIGDLLTEFHGFQTARKIIFLAFLLNAVAVGFLMLAAALPPSQYFQIDDAFRGVFLAAPRILAASFTAFVLSGICNSWLFDYFKRRAVPLLRRSSASSFCAIALDSAVFITLAFGNILPLRALWVAILGQILAKICVGIFIGAPATWCAVKWMGQNRV